MGAFPVTKWVNIDNLAATREMVPAINRKCLSWRDGGFSNIERARRNLANRTVMSVTGSPVVNSGYTTGRGQTNYFRSGLLEPLGYTVLFFGRFPDDGLTVATRGTVIGNFVGSADPGMVIYQLSSTQLRAQAAHSTNTSATAPLTVAGYNLFKRYRVTVDPSLQTAGNYGSITFQNETDGGAPAVGNFGGPRDVGTQPICHLSALSPALATGNYHGAHESIWEGVMTVQESVVVWAQIMAIQTALGNLEGT